MDQVILPEHVENDMALGAAIPFMGLGASPLRNNATGGDSAQALNMLLGYQASDLAKGHVKPPSDIADRLIRRTRPLPTALLWLKKCCPEATHNPMPL